MTMLTARRKAAAAKLRIALEVFENTIIGL
jgi:hypothetical protein